MTLDPRVRLLTLSGELGLAEDRALRTELMEAAGDRTRELIIDLRGVTFLGSSTLAILVHAHQQLERQARTTAWIVRPGPVQRLLDASGLRDALPVCESPEEGVARVLRLRRAASGLGSSDTGYLPDLAGRLSHPGD
jgi:anti-anti-sigma factor